MLSFAAENEARMRAMLGAREREGHARGTDLALSVGASG